MSRIVILDDQVATSLAATEQLKGSMSYGNCTVSGNLERANYMQVVVSYTADFSTDRVS